MSSFPIVDPLLIKWGGFSPHPSRLIQQKGLAYFDEIEQDTHLRGELNTRAYNAIIPDWVVRPASDSATDRELAEFISWNLRSLDGTFIADLFALGDAMGKGFAILERIYEPQSGGKYDGKLRLRRLKQIPAKYVGFDFDEAGEIKSDGILFSPYSVFNGNQRRFPYKNFVHVTHGITDNPYGDPLDLRCAFWVWMKKNIAKFWGVFCETFASPIKIIEGPQGMKHGDENFNAAQKIIDDLQQQSGLVVPKGFKLSLLEALRTGDANYNPFIDRCNNEISIIVLGATQSTRGASAGQSGGYAAARQHGAITDNYAYADALWLEYVVTQQIIKPLVELNYDTGTPLPTFRLLDDDVALMIAMSQSILNLVNAGVNIPQGWVNERLNIRAPYPGESLLQPQLRQAPPSPAAPDNRTYNFRAQSSSVAAARKPQSSSVAPHSSARSSSVAPHSSAQSSSVAAARKPQSSAHKFPVSDFKFSSSPPLERGPVLDSLEAQGQADLTAEINKLLEKPLSELAQLPEGQIIASPPPLKLNMGQIKKLLSGASFQHYLYGKYFGVQELERGQVQVSGKSDPVPDIPKAFRSSFIVHRSSFSELPGDTLTRLAKEIPLTPSEMEAIVERYDQRFFEVSGLLKADIEKIWTNQILALKEGWILRDFQDKLQAELLDLSTRQTELIYRNWMMSAFAEGKNALANDPDLGDTVWGYRYNAILDSRVRATHERLDGTVLPKDHEFWQQFTPPIFHNCRCDREFVTIFDIQDGTYQETDVPPTADIETF